ncbi:MAG: RusA family crossover junction endodeoxyribonuclease [Proteobacteria bacterium]|nr:RusA family crossover junction endodeoxyribonuclease [Pseudomonadota bacterium]
MFDLTTYTKYEIVPVSKPRMTRSDKWKQRPCVLKYRSFKDLIRENNVYLPESKYHVVFQVAIPKSWPKKKKALMLGQPHQQRPDKDNFEKALLDALFQEDSAVWDGRASKIWGKEGAIFIGKIKGE